jgi:hypothetical protein
MARVTISTDPLSECGRRTRRQKGIAMDNPRNFTASGRSGNRLSLSPSTPRYTCPALAMGTGFSERSVGSQAQDER